MASDKLISYVNNVKNIIKNDGYSFKIADALCKAGNLAIKSENDIDYGLETLKIAKKACINVIRTQTKGSVWQLEKYCMDNNISVDILNVYYECLKLEAPYLFESFIFYMERKRPQDKRFYLPRMRSLKVVCDDLQRLEDTDLKFYGLSMPSRVGKELADNTPILTRKGWKNHGDLIVGDEVINSKGEFVKVTYIHPKCNSTHIVKFTDGEEIECHANHEWIVYDRHLRKTVTIETKKMAESYLDKTDSGSGFRSRYFINQKTPVIGEYKELPIKPYSLGAWLGDGTNTDKCITIDSNDKIIAETMEKEGYPIRNLYIHNQYGTYRYSFEGLRGDLQKEGMCFSHHTTIKHIPEIYFTASIEQRLELLAGLLDTDGTLVLKEHRYQFSTTEEQLKDDFVSLVATFGWRTCVCVVEPRLSSSGIQGRRRVYKIGFNPTMAIPCRLERKQLKVFSKPKRVGIAEIRLSDKKTQGNCITVEGGEYLAGKTLKPTHNSTICIFFLSWIALKRPNSHSLMTGHSGMLADGFYTELLNFITDTEYCFEELFHDMYPEATVLQDKSAEKHIINLDKADRFATLTCRGIDGTLTGDVDVSDGGFLYVDDLVRDREHSLSPQRMEKTFQEYLNKCVDRKIGAQVRPHGGAKELMVGTLWNVLDPLERMRIKYKDDEQYLFRRIPALDENDKSNFYYEYNKGFSSEYYIDMRDKLDNAEWMAKFMQQPYVREGIVFQADELRYFNGILPEGEHRTVAVVDIAWGGGDHLSMPIGALYENGDCYIFDWVFNNQAKEVTIPLVVGQIINNEIRQIRFEGNTGGELYQAYVDEQLQKYNYKCSSESKKAPVRSTKMEKIIAYSGDIKRKFVFLQPKRINPSQKAKDEKLGIKRYYRTDEYQCAMDELCSFVKVGKNDNDDSPDSLAQLEMLIEGDANVVEVKAMMNPFRMGRRY